MIFSIYPELYILCASYSKQLISLKILVRYNFKHITKFSSQLKYAFSAKKVCLYRRYFYSHQKRCLRFRQKLVNMALNVCVCVSICIICSVAVFFCLSSISGEQLLSSLKRAQVSVKSDALFPLLLSAKPVKTRTSRYTPSLKLGFYKH